MALFDRKKSPLSRLKKRDWSGAAELEALFAEISEEGGVKIGDLMWGLTDTDRELRNATTAFVLAQMLPGTSEAILDAAASRTGPSQRGLLAVLARITDPALVPRLGQMIKSGRPEHERVATEALFQFPVQRVSSILVQFLRDGEPEMRLRSLNRLTEGLQDNQPLDPRMRAMLEAVVSDPDEQVRLRAFELLANDPTPQFIEVVLQRVRTERALVKKKLVSILEHTNLQHDPRIVNMLVPLLGEGDDLIRRTALSIALRAGNPRDVIERVVLFSKSLMGWMRIRIHRTIAEFGDELLEPMIQLLSHADPAIRSSALLFAVNFDSPKLIAPCVQLLTDRDWWIRVVAIDTLGRLGAREATGALIGCLDDQEARWSAVEALAKIGDPASIPHVARLLQSDAKEIRLAAIGALEVFDDPRGAQALKRVVADDGDDEVRERAFSAVKVILTSNGVEFDALALRAEIGGHAVATSLLDRLLAEARRVGASDLHVAPGNRAVMRRHGDLARVGEHVFSGPECLQMLQELLTPEQRRRFLEDRQIDFTYAIEGVGRYRASIFDHRQGFRGVFRVLSTEAPSLADIGAPEQMTELQSLAHGLVLVTGPAGSGKTTTLAAVLDLFNTNRAGHIITVDDPIEFIHPLKQCLINQREVGRHAPSYAAAVNAAVRHDPDVIAVGDLRDVETVRAALTAAEMGYVVVGCMASSSVTKALQRFIDVFPPNERPQARQTLGDSLRLVTNQRLVKRIEGDGVVAAFEQLVATPAVGNAIRDDKIGMLQSIMEIGRNLGMRTRDYALADLVRTKRASMVQVAALAEDREALERHVSGLGLKEASHG